MNATTHRHPRHALAAFLALSLALLLPLAAAAGSVMDRDSVVQADWRLEIVAAAAVDHEQVTLGDLARPLGAVPAQQWRELSATPVCRAPEARGEQQRLSQEVLGRMLLQALGPAARLCMLPPFTVIQRGGAVLDAGDLNRLVVETLTPRIRAMDGEAQLRDMRLPEHLFLDDRMDTVEMTVVGEMDPGRLSLRFEVKAPDGQVRRKRTGQVFLDLWVTAPVASRPLNRGEALSPEVVTHRRVNAAYLRGEPWDGRDFALRMTAPVGTDQVIYADALELVPTVSRGDTVLLVYNGRNVRLSVDAEALADGGMGDYIPVRNLQSRRQVMAKVHDTDTVVVR